MVIEEPRSARREATRQRILDAARVVFAEKGVFGASIEDICERAGFTRGAVYSNFADKDDILREVIEREHEALLAHITGSIDLVEQELATAPTLEGAVASLVNRIGRTIPLEREVTLISTELEIVAVRRPDLAASFLVVNNRFRERLAAFLVAALERVGREPVVDPLDVIDAVKAIGERSVRRALIEGPDADPDGLSESVLPALLLSLSRPIEPRA
jgi:AcrR family transcriptional regulator